MDDARQARIGAEMPLTSVISPYDARWPSMFDSEAEALRPIFGAALVGIHHIGSTAVPGLHAKPEIDLLSIVAFAMLDDWTSKFADRGFRRGGDLSEGHHFFKRDVNGVRTHKLHICLEGHPEAHRMLRFRHHLRENSDDRLCYQALKLRLEAENRRGIQEYLEQKAPFIRSILDKIG